MFEPEMQLVAVSKLNFKQPFLRFNVTKKNIWEELPKFALK